MKLRWMLISTAAFLGSCQWFGGESREFRDCVDCPEMVVIVPGTFTMGSPLSETENRGWPANTGGNERPVHQVTIRERFAIGKFEVTRAQYARFVAETGYEDTGGCIDFTAGGMSMVARPEFSWRKPGFDQRDDEPALCLSWLDAQAYVAWLGRRTGQPYRLPSEAEWEYAARAGTTTTYPWGDTELGGCQHANVRTLPEWQARNPGKPNKDSFFDCDDGHQTPAPVGSYKPNGFGLHDMIGNVFEWVADCNHTSYEGAPTDGSAWIDDPKCVFRIMRGGSYANPPRQTRAAARVGRPVSGRAPMLGVRVARSLDGGAAADTSGPVMQSVQVAGVPPEDAALFQRRCAACHVDGRSFKGVYGRDLASVVRVITDGGTNSMSMPAWKAELTADEIRRLAEYVRAAAGWR